MSLKKALLALTAAAIMIPGTVAAGFSSGTSLAGNATAVESSDDGLTTVAVNARYTGVLSGNGIRLVLECDAEGVGAVAATGVDDCYAEVNGIKYRTQGLTLPGNASATAGTFHVPLAPITVCVRGRAVSVLGNSSSDAFAERCVQSTVIGDVELPKFAATNP